MTFRQYNRYNLKRDGSTAQAPYDLSSWACALLAINPSINGTSLKCMKASHAGAPIGKIDGYLVFTFFFFLVYESNDSDTFVVFQYFESIRFAFVE